MYYERSLRSKYRSQGVQTSFYESTPSPTDSLGDKISTGSTRNFGHAGTDHPYAPKERDNGSASRLARVLLERIPGKEGLRRVASSHRSKESERTHSRTSFPYVHDKLCSKLCRKRRFILNRKKSELDLTQDLKFLGIHLHLDLGRALLPQPYAETWFKLVSD